VDPGAIDNLPPTRNRQQMITQTLSIALLALAGGTSAHPPEVGQPLPAWREG